MPPFKVDKKDEEEGHSNPFSRLEKSRVLQEARVFNEMPINPKHCGLILTKILFLLYQGETIGPTEATETFFAMTKLFQNKDTTLRKMVFLTIKEMAKIAQDVIIVTSSLTKDMTGKEDAYRAGAIRALCRITDSSMLQSVERYVKQAIVDKNTSVQSSALVSATYWMRENPAVVARWVNEVQQALTSKSPMAQYHALGLLYSIKQKDRLAVSKLVLSQIKTAGPRSPHATCLLIRLATKVAADDVSNTDRSIFDFLDSCLRNKSEMVIYEAARAIVNLTNVSARELAPAVSVLQLFLSSPKPTLRFAAVRTLNKVAMTHPASLKTCNLDMENLITDSNRSIATLAITTLLKTGNENSIDRLMKQISSFMAEISDEFKIVVIDAIRVLCLKFPKKQAALMSFLSTALREEGGAEYKRAIVETIISLVENIPEAKDTGLAHLCEFIEDCEYSTLLTRILFVLGMEGPVSPQPGRYIRHIYNRIILETAVVRAAAVTALARFGAQCDALRGNVIVLLRRCTYDSDDEVRDRACLFIDLLENQSPALLSKLVLNAVPFAASSLERSLGDYLNGPTNTPFDISTVPLEKPSQRAALPVIDSAEPTPAAAKAAEPAPVPAAATFAAIPALAHLGVPFKSSAPVALTESETEYVVKCIKHVFPQHVALQFIITNTLNDQQIEDVRVVLESASSDVSQAVSIAAPAIKFVTPGVAFVVLPLDHSSASDVYNAKLEFVVKDCDPETGECDEEGYADSYTLEDVELTLGDKIIGVDKPNFGAAWQEYEEAHEHSDTFALSSMATIEEATTKITSFLGMFACERSGKPAADKTSHTLFLAGIYVGGHEVLARARLAIDQGVTMNLTVRSRDDTVCELVTAAVG